MPVAFIDYIPFYYQTLSPTPEPDVVEGKFVQIRNGALFFIILAPKGFAKYHANIVERFCLDKGLEGGYDPEGKRFAIADTAWIIRGGGKFELNRSGKTIKFFDDSMAYGKFDPEGLRQIAEALPEYTGYRVAVE